MKLLTVFMSAGGSLTFWQSEGWFSREILIYRELLRRGDYDRVQIFSYDAADRAFLAERAKHDPLFGRIDILAPDGGKGGAAWSLLGVWRNRARIARSEVIKTNQISGAWAAWLASVLTGVPLVLRMGYILSRRFALNGQKLKAAAARAVEWLCTRRARAIIVTSQDAAEYFRADPAIRDKVRLLPTFVDVETFQAISGHDFDAPLLIVARLRPQKNLPELFRGCALAGVDLVLVGKGEQEEELRALAAELPVRITFAGTMDNLEIAALMARHSIFILPSLHEGLPKVLIEAMATGMVCIGSNIPGITDLIADGDTGYLTDGFTAQDIAAAITRARTERDGGIGSRARARIERDFGLGQYAAREAAILRGEG